MTPSTSSVGARVSLAALVALTNCAACKKEDKPVDGAAAASGVPAVNATAPAASNPAPAAGSARDVPAPYTGPVGRVEGVVRMTGDAPVELTDLVKAIPLGRCFTAHERYKRVFREGEKRGVADALVAVSHYEGRVVAQQQRVQVEAKDCAYDRRTIALALGQTIEVHNRGGETYMPQLRGTAAQALLVAMPGGEPIRFTPPRPGRYQLVDHSHPYIFADVFVLQYPTVAVSDEAGKFTIEGIPVGRAKVSALLPITNATADVDVEIKAEKTTTVELQLAFDAAAYQSGVAANAEAWATRTPPQILPKPGPSAAPAATQ